jgi:hypothetical protein
VPRPEPCSVAACDQWPDAEFAYQSPVLVVVVSAVREDHVGPVVCDPRQLKGVELANLAADTLAEVTAAAERGIQRLRGTHHLAFSFLRCCGLSLW